MSRYLTTQERVDLAVKAGHHEAVMEHIRMHNNGDGLELETLVVTTPNGDVHRYTRLPSYGVAAVDCYINMFNIPTTDEADVNKAPETPKVSMLTVGHLKYANHCHEQAAYFQDYQGMPYSGRLKEDAEYAAAHTAFSMIEEITLVHPFEIHGNTLVVDDDNKVTTIKLASGKMVCRGKGFASTVYYKHDDCVTEQSVDDILNYELNELVDTLYAKSRGLN